MNTPSAAPQHTSRRAVLAMAAGTVVLAPAARGATPGARPDALPADSFYRNFQALALLDQDGRPIAAERLPGRIRLVNFVFTGCSTVCPVQTRALVELQQRLPPALKGRLGLMSVSIDPLNDTPKALKAFAVRMGADLSNWSFVTGRPGDIERLGDQLRLFRPGAGVRRPDDHSTAVWLVDAQGRLRQRYAGNPLDLDRLVVDLRALDALAARPGGSGP